MTFLGKGSKVDMQYMATEMGIEDVLGMRAFELRDASLNNEYFDEEFCREFLNTIIEERERKEEIELDERKRKEERELAERKRKEEMELAKRKTKEEIGIAERKRRADFEQRMRDVKMEFETQKKLIELEGEGHLARACVDMEVSTDIGNIGNEVISNLRAVRPDSRLMRKPKKWRIDSRLMGKPNQWRKGGRWKKKEE
ncbi:hypothetical protein TNCV_1233471 [Trichonephila clavipes]|nr:hypothetical protein TNCV_1233471 [Trichonephila clavipes]